MESRQAPEPLSSAETLDLVVIALKHGLGLDMDEDSIRGEVIRAAASADHRAVIGESGRVVELAPAFAQRLRQ